MATSGGNIQKFCLEHMVRDSCSRPGCTFQHYERQRVQVITVKSEEGFVEGRLSYIPLCRFHLRGVCRFGSNCRYRHEINVTLPSIASTPSTSSSQNNCPKPEQSRDKTCGICFEVILEKVEGERKFGILPNCSHCYCIVCISKWRQSTQFEHKIIKACPECRVTSDFICPSTFWVENKEEKDQLIQNYKKSLSMKDCKHFKKGAGKCPFGNKCFYKHAYPDGRICDVGPPRRRHNHSSLGNITNSDIAYLQHIILWNVIDYDDDDDDDDDGNIPPWELEDMFDDLGPLFTSSDNEDLSDLSDFEYLLG